MWLCYGWPDGRWTLAHVHLLLAYVKGVHLSVRGVRELWRRHGWSCRQPARRAVDPNDAAVGGWIKETWRRRSHRRGARGLARHPGRGRCLDDVAPQSHMGPSRAHSHSPLQRGSRGRITLAAPPATRSANAVD
ncbi:winged helix-turn-helix domain-containing protein [Streptomyces sp. NPDC004528]|uniref:helix-turn-helix domain-containing protein n=1 Tax=Streptomyces sp. NPDC004528 TaxID=3154550 RepID=UPI0033A1CB51